ncbi:MAG: EAL domain-containing protein, partial [Gammaproteobacteria bacterium]
TEHLCFEVTETSAISNMSSAIRFMNTLRGVGCHFALDDFGSGLSSFAYLKSLPIDSVKIDGVFIRDLENDMTHRAIVTSIASVARVMNISTIAEFVENEAICSTLKDIGVDYAQGYHFARPLPFEAELMKHPDYSI